MRKRHRERHFSERSGWLRAAVLGANDGIVSTASLVVGVAAAGAVRPELVIAGVAGMIAGAMSMAAGEYVSVSSQADLEKADLERERWELKTDEQYEHEELAGIYVDRGLDKELAKVVADQLMAHDALGAHARDELGLTDVYSARPIQAALVSAVAFIFGAVLPVFLTTMIPLAQMIPVVAVITLLCLVVLGYISARIGGARIGTSIVRVTFWGALAMLVTAVIGKFVETLL